MWSLGLLTVASLCLIVWQGAFRSGLIGSYYTNPGWQGSPVGVSIDSLFSTSRLTTHAARWRPYSFSVSWKGFLQIDRPGSYTATIRSDDGAWLFVDQRLVLNNGGEHTATERSATVVLDAGLHPIELNYFQGDGDFELGVTWAYDREAPIALSESTLFPTKLAYAVQQALPPRGYLVPLLWSLSIAGLFLWFPVLSFRRHVRTHATHGLTNTLLLGVLALSLLLSVPGISWGLPSEWTSGELLPLTVLDGLGQRFSDGWSGKYPPVHYYLLATLYAPFSVTAAIGLTDVWSPHTYILLVLLARAVSVLMACGMVYVIYLCGVELYRSRFVGILAAFLVATMPPFVYHAKTANLDVPYLFWFSLSLLYYVRAVLHGRTSDYVCLGITAALATCTKDQAFGFYVLPAAHLVWLRLRAGQGATLLQRLSTVFTDRPLRLAAIASMVTFALAHNLLFNIAGFTEHVRIITGPASVPYQVFERTLEGHLQMLWEALRQVLWSFGWPGLALCVAGLVRSLRPGHRAPLFVLLPAVSYYAFFISIVMFHYSRFLLGICAILAIFGGRLAADILEHGRAIWWRRGALAAILTYSVFNGAYVNVVMLNDSRYEVEFWLDTARPDASIAFVGSPEYMPRPDGVRSMRLREAWPDVRTQQPDLIVINTALACRARPDSPAQRFYERLRDPRRGYERVHAVRSAPRWPVSGPDSVWRQECANPFTSLGKINPEIHVFEKSE